MKRIFLLLLVSVFISSWVIAQTDDQGNRNDPTVNERANACYEGGNMEGKCDTEWEWTCGWYMIRYDYGLFSRETIPASCATLLAGPQVSGADCVYLSALGIYVDFNGGNYLPEVWDVYLTSSCSNSVGGGATNLIYAPNGAAEALAICQSHGHNTIEATPEPYIFGCYTI
jgi:hypothetical protein